MPQRDCSGSVCPINPWNRLSKKTNTFFSEKQKTRRKGTVALVALGDELLVRHLDYAKDSLWLKPENPKFETKTFMGVSPQSKTPSGQGITT